ncbi:uncharacterized protein E5676_scaffold832G001210 [Cucumis melo var. makuwa]|uniref:Uncharacterized protein n=1 Tax=Cucumis melo var. makuwa TaxID=1194695 RepID=A0A5D3CPY6_CUCMM|nr:uncharacterized protein E5676_scaffold832G001210 [Cucumis melo var. makuwa]
MDDDNVKVSVDMVANGNCFIPVPTREGRTMLSQEMKRVYQADLQLPSLTLNKKRALVTQRLLL